MNKTEKDKAIEVLVEQLASNSNFYLTDISELTVEHSNNLRRICFNQGIQIQVVKNTLLRKAFERSEKDYQELYDTLKGATSIMFSESGNAPAKLIASFRKKHPKPILKAAYVEESVYIGDDQLKALVSLKTKNELIGEIIGLLQSPAKNVVSQLQSGGHKIAGVLKTLSEKES
jgi:large subunit ribosomal protein L10